LPRRITLCSPVDIARELGIVEQTFLNDTARVRSVLS
jgi:hypothetical protein